jgi:uncharacterized membrane protein SirB2
VDALYWPAKVGHIAFVIVSGGLFGLRGLMMATTSRYTKVAAVRRLSYAIDTMLLCTALVLVVTTRQFPIVEPWLTVKVVLLGVYIVLGVYALRRGSTRSQRIGFLIAAIGVYLFIISVAYTRNPYGILFMLAHGLL